jgi:hypothetical protein
MSIDVTLTSPAPPAAVLASIRRLAGEWRESKIPHELREDRVLTIEGYVEGAKFRFAYMRRWYWRGEAELHVRGTVRPGPFGGSVVIVHSGTELLLPTIFAVAVGTLGVWVFWGDPGQWVVMAIVVAMVAIVWVGEARISRTSTPQADYLIRRIETAVADAVAPGAGIVQPHAG